MIETYDVIVIGSGSIGNPTAFYLAQQGFRVLVLDQFASPGQGSNKSAIGGIRATHTDPAKIRLCQTSLDIFSQWEDQYGDDIEWIQGGYSFVAYTDEIEETLKATLQVQQQNHALIQWRNAAELTALIPNINPINLRGGTFSPKDGSASPLKAALAFVRQAKIHGADFHFSEKVTSLRIRNGRVIGVKTNKGTYHSEHVINCAGAWSDQIAQLSQSTLPVIPDAHQAGVTEPIAPILDPMLVDMRSFEDTANFYFYQHKTGQLIFCSTPTVNHWGLDVRETSNFLPTAARRMLSLIPGLSSVRVRRTWKGLYPMTPDGSPLIGWDRGLEGLLIAAGMCGQGFMLGPGVGKLISRVLTKTLTEEDHMILTALAPDRQFNKMESLK